MSPWRDLRLVDAAIQVDDEVTRLLESQQRWFIHRAQLLDAAHGIPSNVVEAFGRNLSVADRDKSLRIARGEASETIRHLHSNVVARRLPKHRFDLLFNKLKTIEKMIDSIVGD